MEAVKYTIFVILCLLPLAQLVMYGWWLMDLKDDEADEAIAYIEEENEREKKDWKKH